MFEQRNRCDTRDHQPMRVREVEEGRNEVEKTWRLLCMRENHSVLAQSLLGRGGPA